jgi:chitodextrinase
MPRQNARSFVGLCASLLVMCALVFVAMSPSAAQGPCRGNWAEGNTYNVGDSVRYNNATYTCLQTHTAYVGANWNPASTPSLWSLGGSCTTSPTPTPTPTSPTPTPTPTPGPTPTPTPTPNPGTGCSGIPTWSATAIYTAGQRASLNGFIWEAKWWNQNQNPETNSGGDGPWRAIGPCVQPGPTPNPGTGLAQVVSQTQFNQMFPNRNPFYSYQGLLDAAATFPAFAGTGDLAMRRREAAAAFANFAHETGGLVHVTEIAKGLYCSNSATPCGVCAAGQSYYGRGPIQLSWNFNYCSAGQALGLNLWANPNLVEQNSAIAWRTAFWYWMTQSGPGTQPAHSCIINNAGFGCTIRSINGALECNGGNPAQVQSRINNFNLFKAIIGATSVGPDGC